MRRHDVLCDQWRVSQYQQLRSLRAQLRQVDAELEGTAYEWALKDQRAKLRGQIEWLRQRMGL